MKGFAIGLIRLYQRTWSQVSPPACRFVPTCSQYGVEALERFGLLRGAWLTVKRLVHCHPFSSGGYDPVP